MENNFTKKSKKLLYNFLKQPGGLSFFPSSFFWDGNFSQKEIDNGYIKFFSSANYDIKDKINKINIYIHIPFCSKICSYCNCFKILKKDDFQIDEYLDYLDKEMSIVSNYNSNIKINVNTVFVGGGTPNILSVQQLEKLYSIISKYFNLEFLESFIFDGHPNYYNKQNLDLLKLIGITRLTFAVQSFDIKVLQLNNRDKYDINKFEENILYAKKIGIKINIDLLVGLKGQSFDSIKLDIDYINNLNIDNLSIHYFSNSNNILYKIDENYQYLTKKIKDYIFQVNIAKNSPNIIEDYYVSKKTTNLGFGAYAVTNIFGEIIFSNPGIQDYYKFLNSGNKPFNKGLKISIKDEMIKYIYLNSLQGINIKIFFDLYQKDIFREFISEFKFLNSNGVIKIKNNIIYSLKNDFDTLIYFNIFFINKFDKYDLNNYKFEEFNEFFLESGELIDK